MIPFYITSTNEYSGKTLLAIGLGLKLKADGLRVGYLKPLGKMPVKIGEVLTDQDAVLIREALKLDDPLDWMCPVVITPDLTTAAYRGEIEGLENKILSTYQKISENKDVLLIGGAGDPFEGGFLGLSGVKLAKLLNVWVILVHRIAKEIQIDNILAAQENFGKRLVGVVLNFVPLERVEIVRQEIAPFLKSKGVEVLGIFPQDRLLEAVTVKELCQHLEGKVLCCEDRIEELVENFSIGAMSLESALSYFRRTKNKAVITGGDRPDIQLAALETSTRCVILTGNLYPSTLILTRAKEIKVPLIVVKDDTFTTVERLEGLLGRQRVHGEKKIQRAWGLVAKEFDFSIIYQKLTSEKEVIEKRKGN